MITDFTFTRHALDRMLDMDVRPDEVRRCLESPTVILESDRGDGRYLYYGDRVTCIVNGSLEVVTVVWRTEKGWREDLRLGSYGGRSYRGAGA